MFLAKRRGARRPLPPRDPRDRTWDRDGKPGYFFLGRTGDDLMMDGEDERVVDAEVG